MKINEFIESLGALRNKSIKAVIETKDYLPFAEKKALAERIVDACCIEENGNIKINEIDKYMVFTVECIKTYTNLEFDEDINIATEEYDELCKHGALNDIIGSFAEEYKIILELVKMQTDYVMQNNTVEYQFAKFLTGIGGSVDSLLNSFASKVDQFDLNSLGLDQDGIQKLLGFMSNIS